MRLRAKVINVDLFQSMYFLSCWVFSFFLMFVLLKSRGGYGGGENQQRMRVFLDTQKSAVHPF
jgi:hypothetical protein